MTLKDLMKNFVPFITTKNEAKVEVSYVKRLSLIVYTSIILISFTVYLMTYNFINNQQKSNEQRLEKFFNTGEVQDLKNSFFKSLKSPYSEFYYKIENNDSIGKILNKFKISEDEIQKIIDGLKKKKLTNIYAGRELYIVLKKTKKDSNKVISIFYPINNTLSVEIKKNKNNFDINENILKLNKKEVVVKNTIDNNLYSFNLILLFL